LGTLRHIVFILKTCMLNVANWFVFVFRHICSSHPCRKSLAAPGMLRTTNGESVSWDSHPSEERSEPPPVTRERKYHYTQLLHHGEQPHHTAV